MCPTSDFKKSSWNSTIQINTVFQAVFLEHKGNLIIFPQKAAYGEKKKKKEKTIHL